MTNYNAEFFLDSLLVICDCISLSKHKSNAIVNFQLQHVISAVRGHMKGEVLEKKRFPFHCYLQQRTNKVGTLPWISQV